MHIERHIINDINIIARWLSAEEPPALQGFDNHLDLIVIAGHAVVPGILGALQLAKAIDAPLLFSGGIGHSTERLKQNLRQNPATAHLTLTGSSEARIFYQIATELFGIPPTRLYVEEQSTNCGENALFSLELIAAKQISAKRILLSQDPLMQKRTRATFEQTQQQLMTRHLFLNWPVFVPQLEKVSGQVVIQGCQTTGSWDVGRFIQLLLGEMKRLHDDSDGYGPVGKGFIGHIEIPDAVMTAWARMKSSGEINAMTRE